MPEILSELFLVFDFVVDLEFVLFEPAGEGLDEEGVCDALSVIKQEAKCLVEELMPGGCLGTYQTEGCQEEQ